VQGKYAMQLAPNNGESESNAPLLSDRQDELGVDFSLFSFFYSCSSAASFAARTIAKR